MRDSKPNSRSAFVVALTYLGLAVGWILVSSLAVGALDLDRRAHTWVEVAKGVGFGV